MLSVRAGRAPAPPISRAQRDLRASGQQNSHAHTGARPQLAREGPEDEPFGRAGLAQFRIPAQRLDRQNDRQSFGPAHDQR
ncbi:hypothetical protein ACFFX0_04865 [Citricoccus parietis]|uniref:Uncharacterized protein n=1 Tax=Citricoccus parietis TaxID=592307 RepID=A0ABV5FV40_9MICC